MDKIVKKQPVRALKMNQWQNQIEKLYFLKIFQFVIRVGVFGIFAGTPTLFPSLPQE